MKRTYRLFFRYLLLIFLALAAVDPLAAFLVGGYSLSGGRLEEQLSAAIPTLAERGELRLPEGVTPEGSVSVEVVDRGGGAAAAIGSFRQGGREHLLLIVLKKAPLLDRYAVQFCSYYEGSGLPSPDLPHRAFFEFNDRFRFYQVVFTPGQRTAAIRASLYPHAVLGRLLFCAIGGGMAWPAARRRTGQGRPSALAVELYTVAMVLLVVCYLFSARWPSVWDY